MKEQFQNGGLSGAFNVFGGVSETYVGCGERGKAHGSLWGSLDRALQRLRVILQRPSSGLGRSGVSQRFWSLGQASNLWCSTCGRKMSWCDLELQFAQGRLARLCRQRVRAASIATMGYRGLEEKVPQGGMAVPPHRHEGWRRIVDEITDAFPVGLNVHILGH
jgi:hypothetical protein